ncbi:hypothetical protein [Planomicrobium okeanokoites]|uniref:hypothetical protein n=1 Tax=Planomicrobium okeanokoites TaxID=244 RepID=UPI002491567E|nr:hypothetical protein [Planomicrobium okeanokoites]
MKQLKWLIATAILSIILGGCSSDEEVIRVGAPYQEDETSGIKFHTDITDAESITDLRDIINTEKEVEQSADLTGLADTFFTLDIPEEGVSLIQRYIWYQEDGSALLTHKDLKNNEARNKDVYILAPEQTDELKRILEE